MSKPLLIDIETYSDIDLRKSNAYRYTESPQFEILMAAYAVGDDPVQVVFGSDVFDIPGLWDPTVEKIAHNAAFERICFSAAGHRHPGVLLGRRYLNPEHWTDTQSLAALAGYPQKLEQLAHALGGEQKDSAGTLLINWFCKPDRKGNRRMPEDHPEKWAQFVEYCRQDVVTLRDVHKKLPTWPTEHEREVYLTDQRINDRGIQVDTVMAQAAIDAQEDNKLGQFREMQEITGLENPNSNVQLLGWLKGQDLEVENLQAATVTRLLKGDLPEPVERALELRQELALVAAKKYQAALDRVNADGRLRGSFAYHGAHTGRWAGRGVQLQNLPSASLAEKDAPGEVVDRTIAAAVLDLYLGYGADAKTLKALVRPMFTGPFTVVDYSAIEARVVAWLAGEEWALQAFRDGRDIYVETAERMGQGFTRKDGKVACIAAGSPVLTEGGLVPIEEVRPGVRVWDGVEWVAQDGPVYKGEKHVIEYGGLTATEDHLVWIEGEPEPVPFGVAAARGARLQQSGAGRRPVRVGGDYLPGTAIPEGVVPGVRSDALHRVRVGAVAVLGKSVLREVQGVSGVQSAAPRSAEAVQSAYVRTAAVRAWGPKLRRAGDRIPVSVSAGGGAVGSGEPWASGAGHGAGPGEQQRSLRAGEPALGHPETEQQQPPQHAALRMGPAVLALRGEHGAPEALGGGQQGEDPAGRPAGRGGASEGVAVHRGTVAVYDLVNAGPRHRFTVSGVLVHNCLALGYNGGIGSLQAMGAEGSDEKLQYLVTQWRNANPAIVQFWADMQRAFRNGGDAGRIRVEKDGRDRRVILPSGRAMVYHDVRERWVEKWGQQVKQLSFQDPKPPYLRVDTYGGRLTENVTQAVARDVLAGALVSLERAGYDVVGHVHDEVLVQGTYPVEEIAGVLNDLPDWAEGLPIDAAGYNCPRYRKD